MPLQTTELLQPIAASKPGGDDIRYDPVFDQIKQARIEEDDLPTGDWARVRKTADYAQVVKLATEVLSKRSKDLQIAAWLTEALLKREGFAGLASGLDLLSAMLGGFWDHLYPMVEDDDLEYRAAPLDWVGQYLVVPVRLTPINAAGHNTQQYRDSRTIIYEKDAFTSDEQTARQQAVQTGRLVPEAFDDAFTSTNKAWFRQLIGEIDKALQSLDKLNATAQEKFGSSAPRLSPLHDAMLDVRQVASQLLAQKLETDPDPVPQPDDSLYASGAPGSAAATISVVPVSRPDAESRIAAAARFLRAEKSTDPAPYLMLRGFRWGELRDGTGEVNPKLLAAPPTELRARLRGMLLDGRWPELLEAGEDVMATPFGRGWLDLQRYILTACNAMGGDYEQVGKSIHGALQSLLRDLPQMPSLVLMDDTPTANAETLGWLRDQNLLSSEDSVSFTPAAPAAIPGGRGVGHAVYLRAMERVRAGEPERAIDLLIKQALQERSTRDRFLRRSEAAQIMVDAGRDAIALPLLEDLLREIDKHTLEEWEAGETVAQPMGLLFRCMRRMQGDTSETQALYLRICRLDPMRAMEIDGNGHVMSSHELEPTVKQSVLDRLINLTPNLKHDPPTSWRDSVEQLRFAVRRDLEWLLNTRRIIEPAPPYLEELQVSLYHYGLPDLTSLSGDSEDTPRVLARQIEKCIESYEPRLTAVRVLIGESDDDARHRIRFVIEALLRMEPDPERVMFDTLLEVSSGEFHVAGGDHA